MVNFLEKIKKCFQDDTVEELMTSLKAMGFPARVTDKYECKEINIYGRCGYILGCIEVRSRNFDLIQVTRTGITTGSYSDAWHEFNLIVKIDANIAGKFGSRPTFAKFKKLGIFPSRLIEVKWIGGDLANKLNDDYQLKKMVFAMWEEQGAIGILITDMPEKRCVIISKTPIRIPLYNFGVPFPLMTPNDMELYNRIAMHVRLQAKSSSEGR